MLKNDYIKNKINNNLNFKRNLEKISRRDFSQEKEVIMIFYDIKKNNYNLSTDFCFFQAVSYILATVCAKNGLFTQTPES